VTSYMPPHLGGIEQIAENLFTGYTSAGVEVRWVASRVPADAPPREGGRIRVPCFNLVEDVLGVPVPVWGPSGWAEIKRLVQWADAIHVLDCLYLSSAMAVMLSKRHDKPVLVSQNIGLIRYAFPPLNWIERVALSGTRSHRSTGSNESRMPHWDTPSCVTLPTWCSPPPPP